jgi:hypothetical protein
MKCQDCKKDKKLSKFYDRSDREGKYHVCKKCLRKRQTNSVRRKKRKLVTTLGGECKNCGYNKCLNALEFHHTEPENKEFGISKKLYSTGIKELRKETKKCVLLCSNCHRELECKNPFCSHTSKEVPKLKNKSTKSKTLICVECNKEFDSKTYESRKYCSLKCKYKNSEKIDWPETKWLKRIVDLYSYSALARKLGVSDNAIRKRIKNH